MLRQYQQLKNVYHVLQASFWRQWYGKPDRKLRLFGVTGTNGKTTTCYILDGILTEAHGRERVGMLTTVAIRIGKEEIINKTKMTTLPSRSVFKFFKQMVERGVTQAVVELTSHALYQGRLHGIHLEGAIVLNIAREHLDYHSTIIEYAEAKQLIINYLNHDAPLIGKKDDEYVNKILKVAEKMGVVTHAFTSSDAQSMETPLPGEVNKENALAAKLLMHAVKEPMDAIERGIAKMDHVPGRMEWVLIEGRPRVLIDYAVTPDALERLYSAMRKETHGKLWAVLGAAGLRDRGKRPAMTQAAAKYVDEIVLTREDPWTEPEEQIFNDLEDGLKNAPVSWQRIVGRKEALEYCIKHATPEDTIVVTGKGAERGMGIGKKIVPWNEREIIEEILNSSVIARSEATRQSNSQ